MIKTHKTEIFPNNLQREFLERNFGVRRFIFNKTIMYLKHKYGDLKTNKSLITKKEVTSLRKELFRENYKAIISTASSHLLDTVMEDVMFALDSLWKKGKDIQLRKKKFSNTCRFHAKGSNNILVSNGVDKYVRLPSLKSQIGLMDKVKMAEPLRWKNAKILTATIKREAGRYFISLSCEIEDSVKPLNKSRHLGLDWGIKTYLTGFDGNEAYEADFDNEILLKLDKRIAKYQRKLNRKVVNSNKFKKVTTKLQQAYLDFNNYRRDYIYKLVKDISDHFDSVSLEGLGVRFVTKNKGLAHKAKQKPFYMFKIILVNKFNQLGKKVYSLPKTFASTQICSSCGYQRTKEAGDKLTLKDREYNCPKCGSVHDRDINAATNIYNFKNLELMVLN